MRGEENPSDMEEVLLVKKRILTVWALLLVLLMVSACAIADAPAQDRAGNPIAVPEKVERVISLAPSVTQVIIDLGLSDKLVAVDTYSAGTKGLPEGLPAFDMMAPDMEQIVALAPDVVLVTGLLMLEGVDQLAKLTDLGICVAYIPSSTGIDGILLDTQFVGDVVGDPEGAKALNDELTAAIDALRAVTDTPISVYFEVGSAPSLYSFGADTFLNEMIELIGGKNIFADQNSWLSVSEESVIAANPAVIFTNEVWVEDAVGAIAARKGWENVDAVKNGRIYQISDDASSQPNHRIRIALEEMAAALNKN